MKSERIRLTTTQQRRGTRTVEVTVWCKRCGAAWNERRTVSDTTAASMPASETVSSCSKCSRGGRGR